MKPLVALAAALSLAGCGNLARPSEELWPYGYDEAGGTSVAAMPPAGQPDMATADVLDEAGPAILFVRDMDGQQTVFIGNRDPGRAIAVSYQLDGEPLQRITLDPGAELPVGRQPGRIVAVE